MALRAPSRSPLAPWPRLQGAVVAALLAALVLITYSRTNPQSVLGAAFGFVTAKLAGPA